MFFPVCVVSRVTRATQQYFKIFKQIPSIQTLQSVLLKIPVDPGLNPFILRHLESVTQKMSMKEKVS